MKRSFGSGGSFQESTELMLLGGCKGLGDGTSAVVTVVEGVGSRVGGSIERLELEREKAEEEMA